MTRCGRRAKKVCNYSYRGFTSNCYSRPNLACYECQLGNLDLARRCLAEAFRLKPGCRQMALDDPDLAPLWAV